MTPMLTLPATMDLCSSCSAPFALDGRVLCECGKSSALMKMSDVASVSSILGLWVPEDLARQLQLPVNGAQPAQDMHVTMAYFGQLDSMTAMGLSSLLAVLRPLIADTEPFEVRFSGVTTWETSNGKALVALVDSDGFDRFRQRLITALDAIGVDASTEFGWVPHVTLMEGPEVPEIGALSGEMLSAAWTAWRFTLAIGPHRLTLEAGGTSEDAQPMLRSKPSLLQRIGNAIFDDAPLPVQFRPKFTKATPEERYTFGPLYLPGESFKDAHDEFTTPDELQKAVWNYVRSGDRRIRLQHDKSVIAGEWVELSTMPMDYDAALVLPSAAGDLTKSARKVHLPAGTAYMGVIWEPWAWGLVTSGELRGLSMGGRAKRVAVDLGPLAKRAAPVMPMGDPTFF